jgi:protein involved in polysaccharide export with SLBB domain
MALLLSGAGVAQAEEPYRLGPQDQLQVKVSDLRAGTGEAYQWQAFAGEFTVAPSGRVALPVAGEVEASGRTTSEVAADLAERLKAKAGLANKPDASVQIVKFRPFYVMGSVEKPGEYEYRPQLSVLQAVSIAGGMQRVPTDALLHFTREAVQARGDIRELSATRLALIARQNRLDAEIRETPLTFSAELQSRAREAEVARMLSEERLALETRQAALAAQIANLVQDKDARTAEQLEMMRNEFARIAGLVTKGLSAMPRQIEASQAIATLEASRLDVQIAVIRARQDISKADRDILELKDQRRNVALQESAETRIKLNETEAKLDAAHNLLRQAEIISPATVLANSEAYAKPGYLILRRRGTKAETLQVDEDDLLQPGDVVRVQPRPTGSSLSMAGGADARALAGQANDD